MDSNCIGDASNGVTRFGVKTEGEGRIKNDSGILSEATGWISPFEMRKIRGMVWDGCGGGGTTNSVLIM